MSNIKFISWFIISLALVVQESVACICYPKSALEFLSVNDTLKAKGGNCNSIKPKTFILKAIIVDYNVGKYLQKSYNNHDIKAVNLKVLEFWPECGLQNYSSDTVTILIRSNDCMRAPPVGDTCLVYASNIETYAILSTCYSLGSFSDKEHSDYYRQEYDSLGHGTIPKPTDYTGKPIKNKSTPIKSLPKVDNQVSLLKYLLIVSILVNFAFLFILFKSKRS